MPKSTARNRPMNVHIILTRGGATVYWVAAGLFWLNFRLWVGVGIFYRLHKHALLFSSLNYCLWGIMAVWRRLNAKLYFSCWRINNKIPSSKLDYNKRLLRHNFSPLWWSGLYSVYITTTKLPTLPSAFSSPRPCWPIHHNILPTQSLVTWPTPINQESSILQFPPQHYVMHTSDWITT